MSEPIGSQLRVWTEKQVWCGGDKSRTNTREQQPPKTRTHMHSHAHAHAQAGKGRGMFPENKKKGGE